MSLISFIFGKRYDKGGQVVSNEFVQNALEAVPILKDAEIFLKDGSYLLLDEDRLRSFVADHSWAIRERYRSEVFDCDDFAACARADLLRAGAHQGFDAGIFVAELIHIQKKSGARHDALLLMASNGTVLYCEPQTDVFTRNLGDVISEAETIWG